MGDTIEEEFQVAIKCENLAENVYREFMKKFPHLPEIVEFWNDMARDESDHAEYLKNVQESLTNEQLSGPADIVLIEELRDILTLHFKYEMENIKTLQDAYNFAYKLENSEVNAAFKILMNGFVKQKERRTFFLKAVTVHLARLTDFSKNYGDSEWRKSISAK